MSNISNVTLIRTLKKTNEKMEPIYNGQDRRKNNRYRATLKYMMRKYDKEFRKEINNRRKILKGDVLWNIELAKHYTI